MQGKTRHFEALDALRGVMAIIVTTAHWPSEHHVTQPNFYHVVAAVDFFFLLSGFVMAANYDGRIRSRADVGRFAWLRVGRLLPLHLATLFALVVIELVKWAAQMAATGNGGDTFTGVHTPPAILSNIFMVHSFGMHPAPTWNEPSWSVSTEMWTYLVFGAVALAAGSKRFWAYAALILVSYIALILFWSRGLHATTGLGIFRTFIGFFLGQFVWLVWRAIDNARPIKLQRIGWTGVEMLVVAGILVWTWFVGLGMWQSFFTPWVLAIGVLVFAVEGGAVSSLLMTKPLRFVGKLSYSIYLVHVIVATLCVPLFKLIEKLGVPMFHDRGDGYLVFGGDALMGDLLFIPFTLANIALGFLTYTFIENPARRWFRDHAPGKKPKPAPAPATVVQ